MLDLAPGVARVDEHCDRARPQDGDVGDLQRARVVVGHEERDPVALAHTRGGQAPGHGVGAPVPRREAHLRGAVDPHAVNP